MEGGSNGRGCALSLSPKEEPFDAIGESGGEVCFWKPGSMGVEFAGNLAISASNEMLSEQLVFSFPIAHKSKNSLRLL